MIMLRPMPKTAWRKHRILDEDGALGPAEPIMDVAFATDPDDVLERALSILGPDLYVAAKLAKGKDAA